MCRRKSRIHRCRQSRVKSRPHWGGPTLSYRFRYQHISMNFSNNSSLAYEAILPIVQVQINQICFRFFKFCGPTSGPRIAIRWTKRPVQTNTRQLLWAPNFLQKLNDKTANKLRIRKSTCRNYITYLKEIACFKYTNCDMK